MKCMRRFFLILLQILSLTFASACSNGPEEISSFEGIGQHWKASIDSKLHEKNGKKKFIITYQYLGTIEEIHTFKKIVFAQGTSLGTEVVNVYDPKYKEELLNMGQYQEENEEKYGIIIEDLNQRKSTDFQIDYYFIDDGETDTFEAIKMDRLNVQVIWETGGTVQKDTIEIRGTL